MPSDFIPRILGRWSSHPEALRRQKRWLVLIGFLPVVLLILAACFWLTDFDAWCSLFRNPGPKALAFFVCVCLSAGFIMALSLLNMVGMTLATRENDGYGRDNMPFPLWLVISAAFFWLLPYGLTFFRNRIWDGPYFGIIQFCLNLLCLLPFVMVLLWTVFARGKPVCGEDERVVHPKLPFVLAALFFFLAVFSLFTDVCATLMRAIPRLTPFLKGFDETLVRLVLLSSLIPLGVICLTIGRLLWTVKKPRRKKRKAVSADDASEAESERDSIPPSARWITGHLPEGVRLDGEVAQFILDDCSHLATGSGASVGTAALFGGLTPTSDQYGFLVRFRQAYEDNLNRFFDNQDPRASLNCADMIVQGIDGSGRTEALLAAAAYASMVRGQNVLYVVPDAACARMLAAKMNARYGALMIDSYFHSDVLVPLNVSAWIDPVGHQRVPDVVFATPESVEACFFATDAVLDAKKIKALKRLIVGFNVVLVDDFMEMSLAVRSHLAFVLDKLRLIMSGEYAVPQMVVATPPLFAPEGVEQLGKRLFGLGQFNRLQNVVLLRPRPCAPYWCGTLRVAKGHSLEKASRELVRASLDGRFATVLYRKGLSETERGNFESAFKDAKDGGTFRVLSRLYEFGESDARQDAIFYLSIACGTADAALRLNLAESEDATPVFFRIAMEDEPDDSGMNRLALLPDETALALRAMHLRGVLPFIDRLTPIPEQVWSHFGISMGHPCIRQAVMRDEVSSGPAVKWHHDDLSEDPAYAYGGVWPYLVLSSRAAVNGSGRSVDFNSLPNTRECIWIEHRAGSNDGDGLVLAKPAAADSDVRRQVALWADERGNPLGESDLAHADEFVLNHGDDEYAAASIVPAKGREAERYAVKITAKFRRGTEDDYTIPIRRLSWSVPVGGLMVPDIRVHEALSSFRMERRGGHAFCVSGRLVGLMNLRGEAEKRIPRDFGYDAYLSCLVLLPTLDFDSSDSDVGSEKYVRDCLSGTWTTDSKSGYSPALTHALTAALRQRLAGWSFFAAAPVFYTEGREGSVGQATMWLVEPTNSGQSAYPALELLLEQNASFRKDVFVLAKDILEQATTIEELRLSSRLAFADEVLTDDDRTHALRILDLMVSRERREADAADREAVRAARKRQVPVRVPVDSYTEDERAFDRQVVGGLLNFEPTIDVTEFAVRCGWDADKIADLFMDVLWNNPQVFYVSKRGRYQWWKNSAGEITRFVITDIQYGILPGQYDECKAELDAAVAIAMQTIEGVADPVQRALLLHDHIVRVCEYDVEAAEEHDGTPLARTVYSVLVRHLAVCEGYTMAYRYLLTRAGIRSEEVVSDKMCHCWNYVQIGDRWYHVDVTWDDPVYHGRKPDASIVSREHFLLSDARIQTKKHYGWDVRGLPAAIDTQYDGHKWS